MSPSSCPPSLLPALLVSPLNSRSWRPPAPPEPTFSPASPAYAPLAYLHSKPCYLHGVRTRGFCCCCT